MDLVCVISVVAAGFQCSIRVILMDGKEQKEKAVDQDLEKAMSAAEASVDALHQPEPLQSRARRFDNIPTVLPFLILWAATLWFRGSYIADPYRDFSPLEDVEIATDFLILLMDELEEWRLQNGRYPDSIEVAVEPFLLPDVASNFSVTYDEGPDTINLELTGPEGFQVRVSSADFQ